MKKAFFFLLLFISNSLAAQDMQRAKETIAKLASPEFYGRGYTFGGERKAADYIAQQFKKIGLKSYDLKGKANYFQSFQLAVNTFPKTPRLEILDKKIKLQAGKDFIVGANSIDGEGEGEIYVADTLLFEQNEQAIKSFLEVNLRNKIILYATKYETKLYELPKPVLQHWFRANAFVKISPKLTMTLSQEAYSPPVFEIKSMVNGQAITDLLPTGTPLRYFLDQELLENYTTQNVIGYIKGTKQSDSLVVFSAHYDHLGSLGKEAIFLGANDNASGISLLLELVHHYANNQPPYSVVFIAFAAEEVGLIGSKYFVENPLFDYKKIKLLVNVDLVGTGNEGIGIVNATVFPDLFKKLEVLNTQHNYFPKLLKRGKAANSDHYFFTEKGVPSFFIYTLGGIQAYHDIDDKPETLPLTKYKELFVLLVQWVAEI